MPFVIQWVDNCSGAEESVAVNTPAGQLHLSVQDGVITQADWSLNNGENTLHQHELQQQLDAYWLNPDTPVIIKLLRQGSNYRNKVWAELCRIPPGETLSYSALAQKIGSAARAVGNACRDNPYPLFIPCHRVIAASGMGGYCGQIMGDLMTIKTGLLAFEARYKL